jgi:hypothetical protein
MGLDMYLSKKTYVKNWDFQDKSEKHSVTIKKGGKVRTDIKPERVSYITEGVAQWRKANHIHQWFVSNCQNGEDNCGEYYVSNEQLQELVDACKKVKESLEKSGTKKVQVEVGWRGGEKMYEDIDVYTDTELAEELLPTQPGFFFGGTDYDKWYVHGLDETINQIEPLLQEEGDGDFYYQSSW